MKLPKVKIRKQRNPRFSLPAPQRPRIDSGEEAEIFAGEVQGKTASMAEERLFRELSSNKNVRGLQFRYTVGAPKGLPGWKELDMLVATVGMTYAIEVDSPFTHQNKKEADRLHDAIVLNELRKQGFPVFPQVIHIDGEEKLFDRESTKSTVRELFG